MITLKMVNVIHLTAVLVIISLVCYKTLATGLESENVITDTLWNILSSRPVTSVCVNYSTCIDDPALKHCQCDDYCHVFRDCCFEVRHKTSSSILDHNREVKCYERSETKTTNHIFLISDCPADYEDDDVRLKCEDQANLKVIEKVPVSNKMTFLSYRNIYCILCNRVPQIHWDVWKVRFYCNTFFKPRNVSFNSLVESYMDAEDCDYIYEPRDQHYARRCLPNGISNMYHSCSDNYKGNSKEICDSYFGVVTIYRNYEFLKAYRNLDCLACNSNNISILDTDEFFVDCTNHMTSLEDWKQRLFVLLDFTNLLLGSKSNAEDNGCTEEEINIQALGRCLPVHCPALQVPYHGGCVSGVSERQNTVGYDFLFVMNNTLDPNTIKSELYSLALESARQCFGSFVAVRNMNKIDIFSGTNFQTNKTCNYVNMYFEMFFLHHSEETDNFYCPGQYLKESYHIVASDTRLMYIDGVEKDTCFIKQQLNPSNFISLTHSLSQSTSGVSCPAVEVQAAPALSETDEQENSQLTNVIYTIGSIVIDKKDVNRTERGFFICIDILKSKYIDMSMTSRDSYYGIITTYTGFIVSVVSLSVTLVHYIVIPNMITRHSVILLHLLVLTLVTHLVYLITFFDFLCWWAAIGLHYLFLSMFTAMSLTLLHISINLRKVENPSYQRSRLQLFVRFISPGYVLPLFVVGTTVLLNRLHFTEMDWYGAGTNICFISDIIVLCITFALPVVVSVVFNIVTFSITFKLICGIQSLPTDSICSITRNNLLMMLKLCSFTGITWIFGFLAALTGNSILVYIFEFTSSLQGLFLSMCLIYNRKVKLAYQKVCGLGTSATTEIMD